MNVTTKEVAEVVVEPWDIPMAKFSPNYKYLIYAVNNDGKMELKVMETSTGDEVEISEFPNGQISSVTISQSEQHMAFLLNRSDSPTNLYVYDFETNAIECLTNTLNPEIDQRDLVDRKSVV